MNLTINQIANQLNISRQTVTARIKRAGIKPVGTTQQRVVSATGAMILKSKVFNFDEIKAAL